jgi:very-long-chain (3R)-3-hydroxyacyl-CoA dehydratase
MSLEFGIPTSAPSAVVKYYLLAYNVLSCLGWSYVLFATTLHVLGIVSASSSTASTAFAQILSWVPFATRFSTALPTKNYIATRFPTFLIPYYKRMQTTYVVSGPATAVVQSLAVLEILHSFVGWVKSPIGTTFMQVFSRLFTVWGVVESFDSVRLSFVTFKFLFSMQR